jgi:hypothetical protein
MQEKHDKHLAHFLREIDKVKKPIGGDVAFRRMIQTVAKLPVDELPVISGFEDGGPISWRRIAALHRELAKQANGGVYKLSCRDTADALEGWSFQDAFALNDALVEAGVITKAENGAAGKRKGVATKWRYLLPLDGDEGENKGTDSYGDVPAEPMPDWLNGEKAIEVDDDNIPF